MLRKMLPVGDVALGPGRFWPEYVTCRRPQVAGTVLKRANSSQTGAAVIVETSASFALVLACVAVAARPYTQPGGCDMAGRMLMLMPECR